MFWASEFYSTLGFVSIGFEASSGSTIDRAILTRQTGLNLRILDLIRNRNARKLILLYLIGQTLDTGTTLGIVSHTDLPANLANDWLQVYHIYRTDSYPVALAWTTTNKCSSWTWRTATRFVCEFNLEVLFWTEHSSPQYEVKTTGEGGRLYWAIPADNYKYLEDLTAARIVIDKPLGGLRVGHWHSESSELSLILKVLNSYYFSLLLLTYPS